MKKLIIILSLSLFCIQNSKAQDFSIVGIWKQVSFEVIKDGNTVVSNTNSGKSEQLKSWSNEYFLFVGKSIENGQATHSFGNGKYSLTGNHYTEKINVHVSPAYAGKELRIHMELKGDTLTQIFPVNEKWKYDPDNCWIEKFILVE